MTWPDDHLITNEGTAQLVRQVFGRRVVEERQDMKVRGKKQVEGDRKNIRAADLTDTLLAVRLVSLGEGVTKYSEGEIVPHADVRLFAINGDGASYVGETRFFQTYLVEAFADAADDWLVGRIQKGERAFLWEDPAESELDHCEKVVAQLG